MFRFDATLPYNTLLAYCRVSSCSLHCIIVLFIASLVVVLFAHLVGLLFRPESGSESGEEEEEAAPEIQEPKEASDK